MRLMLVWAMATTFPTVMVATARTHRTMFHWTVKWGKTSNMTRAKAAKAAALTPTAMKAVTLVGAPSYTSGVHMWKGTEATLKPKPTMMRARPSRVRGLVMVA